MHRSKTGGIKNGMDIAISGLMGDMVAQNTDCEYYIVSMDHGYDLAIQTFRDEHQVKIERIYDTVHIVPDPTLLSEIRKHITKDQCDKVLSAFGRTSVEPKDIYTELCVTFGHDTGATIYKAIQPAIISYRMRKKYK